jgi:deoxyadenosine/deoxycytidine kinase
MRIGDNAIAIVPGLSLYFRVPLRSPLDFRYIAIEGPTGVGKSLLADRLGSRLDATVVLDETENPFLADFYSARPGAGFQAQLFYNPVATSSAIRAAAERSLQPADDLRLPVRSRQDLRLPQPGRQRAVHLSAVVRAARRRYAVAGSRHLPADPTEVLKRRLRERERANPELASPGDEYVRELNEAYNHFFFHYNATPLLVVETSQFDLSWGEEALGDLEKQLRGMGKGTRYYVHARRCMGGLLRYAPCHGVVQEGP